MPQKPVDQLDQRKMYKCVSQKLQLQHKGRSILYGMTNRVSATLLRLSQKDQRTLLFVAPLI